MFLEKMMSLTRMRSGDKIMDMRTFSVYNTLHNKTRVTEFRYRSDTSFHTASMLHEIKHANVLRCLKVDAKRRTIVTERIFPFRDVLNVAESSFNKHCAYALACAIHFLHSEYMLGHNNISLDALFVTQNLNFVLGSFDMCKKNTFQKDLDDFRNILSAFNLPSVSLKKVLENKTWFSPFLDTLESFLLGLPALNVVEKRLSIERLVENKDVLGRFFREKMSEILIVELHGLRSEQNDPAALELKQTIVELILELGSTRDTTLHDLLLVLDPSIRLYLLKSPVVLNVDSLDDKAVESILLGIKCKDRSLQIATIKFVSQYYARLTEKQRIGFVKAVAFLNDRRLLAMACSTLCEDKDARVALRKEICKLIIVFLPVEDLRAEVLPLMKVYYKDFEFSEVCGKVIFILFELVRCKDLQESAFELIDLFVQHLKRNREAIVEKNWYASDLTAFFFAKKKDADATAADDAVWSTKPEQTPKKEGNDSGWDDEW
jgi:hypothetical protein